MKKSCLCHLLKITWRLSICFPAFFVISVNIASSQPILTFTAIDNGYVNPLDIKYPGNDANKIFVVEQIGRIYLYDMVSNTRSLFLDISGKIFFNGGQKGLLGLAFDPNYNNNGRFYVYYNDKHRSNVTVARYKRSSANPLVADPGSGKTLLSEPKPYSGGIHNGGCMQFGSDGYLYIGFGDGTPKGDPFNIAQNGSWLYGKMLRIDVNEDNAPYYKIPADNPFVNNPNIKDEIWALGLRNPWRFSFDRKTGDLWIGDVGQKYFEEIDYVKPNQSAGRNYGWRCYEGNAPYSTAQSCNDSSQFTFPAFVYKHDVAPSPKADGAVVGGYVYRGKDYPALKGYYICGDYMLGVAFLIKPDGNGGWLTSMQSDVPKFTSFGEDENGELYGVAFDGKLYRISAEEPAPASTAKSSTQNKSSVYPTLVTNGNITVALKDEFEMIRLIDMTGKEVYNIKIPAAMGSIQLNIPGLRAGMYVLQLTGKNTEQHKIVVQ